MTEQAVVEMLTRGQEDARWFNSNLTAFLEQFNNKFVAFHNKQILGAAETVDELISKLLERQIDPAQVLIRFVSKVKSILQR